MMSEQAKPKQKTGWLHTLVDYGPLLVFLGVYKLYEPPATSTFGEIAAVIYGTIAFMIAAGWKERIQSFKGVESLAFKGIVSSSAISLHLVLFMLMIVAVETEQFPVTPVRGIILVVVILVVDGQFLQVFPLEIPSAASADMREKLECPGAVSLLLFRHFLVYFCKGITSFHFKTASSA